MVLIQDFAEKVTAEAFRSHVTEYVQRNNIGSEQSPNQTNTALNALDGKDIAEKLGEYR